MRRNLLVSTIIPERVDLFASGLSNYSFNWLFPRKLISPSPCLVKVGQFSNWYSSWHDVCFKTFFLCSSSLWILLLIKVCLTLIRKAKLLFDYFVERFQCILVNQALNMSFWYAHYVQLCFEMLFSVNGKLKVLDPHNTWICYRFS